MTCEQPSENSLELGHQLCFSVYSTAHAFTRFYSALLEDLDLTYTQYLVLLVLWDSEGLTVKSLGEQLALDSGTLTPLLRRLEETGYIQRSRDGTDQRCLHVYLTSAGRALQADAEGVRQSVFEATGLDMTGVQRLQSELNSLREALDDAAAQRCTPSETE